MVAPDRRPHLLLIESGTTGGGSFESLYLNLKYLDRNRFRASVVFVNPTGYPDRLRRLGIRSFVLTDLLYSRRIEPNLQRALTVALRLARLGPAWLEVALELLVHLPLVLAIWWRFWRSEVGLVHLNGQIERDLFGLLVARLLGAPVIAHLRSPGSGRPLGSARARIANGQVRRFLTYSPYLAELWQQRGLRPDGIQVIENGIEIETAEPLDLVELLGPRATGATMLACVGNVMRARGYSFMIQGLARLRSRAADLQLVIAGHVRPGQRAELQHLARRLGVEDRLHLPGWVPAAARLIAASTVLVLPYRHEALGRVLLEAWVNGVPVVATRYGQIERIVRHEENALLVEYGAAEDLAAQIARVLDEPDLRARLVAGGQRTVAERFDIRKLCGRLERLYEALLQETDGAG